MEYDADKLASVWGERERTGVRGFEDGDDDDGSGPFNGLFEEMKESTSLCD